MWIVWFIVQGHVLPVLGTTWVSRVGDFLVVHLLYVLHVGGFGRFSLLQVCFTGYMGAFVPVAYASPCPGFSTVGKPRLVVVAVQGAPR